MVPAPGGSRCTLEKCQTPCCPARSCCIRPLYAAAISAAMLSGVSGMHTVPITEGYAVPRDSLGLVLFGRGPTEYLKQLFIERWYTSSTTAERVVKANLFHCELDFVTLLEIRKFGRTSFELSCFCRSNDFNARHRTNRPKFCWFGDKHGHVILHARVY